MRTSQEMYVQEESIQGTWTHIARVMQLLKKSQIFFFNQRQRERESEIETFIVSLCSMVKLTNEPALFIVHNPRL